MIPAWQKEMELEKTSRIGFNKRIYNWRSFSSDLNTLLDHLGDMRASFRSGKVSRAFAEKIMLVVTSVNGCRYCSYAHTRAALAVGVSADELKKLINFEFSSFPENEVVALAFAQHYAESGSSPDPAAWHRVQIYYMDASKAILSYIRMITFGNLYGNTFDALMSRLKGKPASGSSFWSEVGILVGVFILLPAGLISRFISSLFLKRSKKLQGT